MENAIIKTEYGTVEAENGTIIYTPEEIQRIEDFKEAAGHIFSENMIQDMAEMGFFRYPASLESNYHGSHIGGLYDHSMAVYRALQYFTGNIGLIWERPESPLLIAIFHDWVKLQDYIRCEEGDIWKYKKNMSKLLYGHGEVSIILAQQFLQSHLRAPQLTQEEIVCIRYHMGAFADHEEWNYYTNAVRIYPNVLWTHTADMVASQIKGI